MSKYLELRKKGSFPHSGIVGLLRYAASRVFACARIRLYVERPCCNRFDRDSRREIVEMLSDALFQYGIFVNIRKSCCPTCVYKKESSYGEWCSLRDEWIVNVNKRYCGGYEEKC